MMRTNKTADEKAKQRLVMAGLMAGVFVILVLVAVLMAIVESYKTVNLDIMVAPLDAKVELNGQEYKNGKYRVEPGEYEVSITHSELESYYEKMTLEDGADVKLYKYLTGKDGDMGWYLTHEKDDMVVTNIGDYFAGEKSKEYAASDPVFAVTPYYDYDRGFRVNAAKNEEGGKNEIIVYLYTCDDGRVERLKKNANAWLESKKIQLDNYIVTYKYCEE